MGGDNLVGSWNKRSEVLLVTWRGNQYRSLYREDSSHCVNGVMCGKVVAVWWVPEIIEMLYKKKSLLVREKIQLPIYDRQQARYFNLKSTSNCQIQTCIVHNKVRNDKFAYNKWKLWQFSMQKKKANDKLSSLANIATSTNLFTGTALALVTAMKWTACHN